MLVGSLFCFFDWGVGLVGLFLFFWFVLFFSVGVNYFSGVFFFDGVRTGLVLLTVWVFILVILASVVDFSLVGYFVEFVWLMSLVTFGLGLRFFYFGFFGFYLGFEGVFFIFFVLLLVWSYSPERFQAAYYMVFYTVLVSFPFLLMVFFLHVFYFDESYSFFFYFFCDVGLLWWAAVFFVFMVKIPLFFVHL